MFRNELKTKLKEIFGFQKVTFDAPSDAFEQDTLFIEIRNSLSRTGQGRASCRVDGQIVVYSQNNKLPYGFFHKRLSQVSPELSKNFFFYDFDQDIASSPARLQNINERRTNFVFLFSTQFDPSHGEMQSFEFGEATLVEVGDGSLLDVGDGKILEA